MLQLLPSSRNNDMQSVFSHEKYAPREVQLSEATKSLGTKSWGSYMGLEQNVVIEGHVWQSSKLITFFVLLFMNFSPHKVFVLFLPSHQVSLFN